MLDAELIRPRPAESTSEVFVAATLQHAARRKLPDAKARHKKLLHDMWLTISFLACSTPTARFDFFCRRELINMGHRISRWGEWKTVRGRGGVHTSRSRVHKARFLYNSCVIDYNRSHCLELHLVPVDRLASESLKG